MSVCLSDWTEVEGEEEDNCHQPDNHSCRTCSVEVRRSHSGHRPSAVAVEHIHNRSNFAADYRGRSCWGDSEGGNAVRGDLPARCLWDRLV